LKHLIDHVKQIWQRFAKRCHICFGAIPTFKTVTIELFMETQATAGKSNWYYMRNPFGNVTSSALVGVAPTRTAIITIYFERARLAVVCVPQTTLGFYGAKD
jgi:hypothetical protein